MALRSQLDQIQFLRGIAAFSILVAHTPYIQRGHFGVDLFFIISGFIMTYVTDKSYDNFLLKRAVRIVPLYWLGTFGLYLIAVVTPGILNTATDSVTDLFRSLFFIPYFNGRTVEPLLRLGWTLNYEVFFYLLFYMSCVINHKYRVLIASASIFLLVYAGTLLESNNVILQFYTDPILLEFVYGMAAYYGYKALSGNADNVNKAYAKIAFFLGVVLYISLFFNQTDEDQAHRHLSWGVPCLLVFMLVLLGGRRIRIFAALVVLGNISYSLYLFHPYVIHLIDRKIFSIASPTAASYLVTLGAYAASIAVAYGSWRFIEKPSQKYLLRGSGG